MIDWNGRDSFLTATRNPVFVSKAELQKRAIKLSKLLIHKHPQTLVATPDSNYVETES